MVDPGFGLPLALLAVGLTAGTLWLRTSASRAKAAALDPGRNEVRGECAGFGRLVLELPLNASGKLQATAHLASQEDELPAEAHPGSMQEWRVLRFIPTVGSNNLVQSITKVCIPPADAPDAKVRMRFDCLLLDYTKSFVSVVLAALSLLGAPLFPSGPLHEPMRILCIGLGGGSVPTFLARVLPHCTVHVVELEAPVLQAATEALGFCARPNLQVTVEDGAAFAEREAERIAREGGDGYDAVLVDAYDSVGNVPPALLGDGPFGKALSCGLLHRRGGLVATNLLPAVDVAPVLATYKAALAPWGAGPGFTVESELTHNHIVVQTCSREGCELTAAASPEVLQRLLARAAREVREATCSPMDMEVLAARNLREWPEP